MIRSIHKILAIFGFAIIKIPQPRVFVQSLIKLNKDLKDYEIRRIAGLYRRNDNHKDYNELLRLLVPHWNAEIKDAKFIAGGLSETSLPSHRQVQINGVYYFEKVFSNLHANFDNCLSFQSTVYPLLHDIYVPQIIFSFRGPLVTIAYFEFATLIRYKSKEIVDRRIIEVSKQLAEIGEVEVLAALGNRRDILSFPHYNSKRELATNFLARFNVDFCAIEEDVRNSHYRFTHGDLHGSNVYEKNTVIDWDDSGMLPSGYEEAQVFWAIHMHPEDKKIDPLTWFNLHYNQYKQMTKSIERNFLFFVIVFAMRFVNDPAWKPFFESIATELQSRDSLLFNCRLCHARNNLFDSRQ